MVQAGDAQRLRHVTGAFNLVTGQLEQHPHHRGRVSVIFHQKNASRPALRGSTRLFCLYRCFRLGLRRKCRKSNAKCCAPVLARTVRGNRPVVHFDQALGDREPQPEAAELARHARILLLEGVEYPGDGLGLDADAAVVDLDDDMRLLAIAAYADASSLGCELDGVVDEVPQDLLQARDVSVHPVGALFDVHAEMKLARFDIRRTILDHAFNGRAYIYGLAFEADLALDDPGQVEQVIDEARLELDIAADDLQVMARVLGQTVFTLHDLHGGKHRGEGRSQLMREHGEKLILGPVGLLRGFLRTLCARRRHLQSRLGALENVDVRGNAEPAHDTALRVLDRLSTHFEPFVLAVVPPHPVFQIVFGFSLDGRAPRRKGPGAIVRMQQPVPAVAQMLAHGHAGEIHPLLALVIAVAVGAGGEHHAGNGLERLAVEELAFLQGLLCRLALGDVDAGADPLQHACLVAQNRHAFHEQYPVSTVMPAHPVLDLVRTAGRDRAVPDLERPLDVFRVHGLRPSRAFHLLVGLARERAKGGHIFDDFALRVCHPGKLVGQIDKGAVAPLARAQGRLGPPAVGHVFDGGDGAQPPCAGVAHRGRGDVHPHRRAIAPQVAFFVVDPVAQTRMNLPVQPIAERPVVRVRQIVHPPVQQFFAAIVEDLAGAVVHGGKAVVALDLDDAHPGVVKGGAQALLALPHPCLGLLEPCRDVLGALALGAFPHQVLERFAYAFEEYRPVDEKVGDDLVGVTEDLEQVVPGGVDGEVQLAQYRYRRRRVQTDVHGRGRTASAPVEHDRRNGKDAGDQVLGRDLDRRKPRAFDKKARQAVQMEQAEPVNQGRDAQRDPQHHMAGSQPADRRLEPQRRGKKARGRDRPRRQPEGDAFVGAGFGHETRHAGHREHVAEIEQPCRKHGARQDGKTARALGAAGVPQHAENHHRHDDGERFGEHVVRKVGRHSGERIPRNEKPHHEQHAGQSGNRQVCEDKRVASFHDRAQHFIYERSPLRQKKLWQARGAEALS